MTRLRRGIYSNVAAMSPAPAPPAGATWDAATIQSGSPAITLSNGNKTAEVLVGNVRQGIRANTSMSAAGKWHFEITFTVAATGSGGGVATTLHGNEQLGGDTESIGVYGDGTVNHPLFGDIGTISSGNVVAFEYDGPNTDLYINLNGGGWQGPYNTAALTGDLYPCLGWEFNQPGTMVLNTGGSAFTITPQSGYIGF